MRNHYAQSIMVGSSAKQVCRPLVVNSCHSAITKHIC